MAVLRVFQPEKLSIDSLFRTFCATGFCEGTHPRPWNECIHLLWLFFQPCVTLPLQLHQSNAVTSSWHICRYLDMKSVFFQFRCNEPRTRARGLDLMRHGSSISASCVQVTCLCFRFLTGSGEVVRDAP